MVTIPTIRILLKKRKSRKTAYWVLRDLGSSKPGNFDSGWWPGWSVVFIVMWLPGSQRWQNMFYGSHLTSYILPSIVPVQRSSRYTEDRVPKAMKPAWLSKCEKSVTSTHIDSKSITLKGVALQKTSLKSNNLAYSGNEDCIRIVLDWEKVERSRTEYRW